VRALARVRTIIDGRQEFRNHLLCTAPLNQARVFNRLVKRDDA